MAGFRERECNSLARAQSVAGARHAHWTLAAQDRRSEQELLAGQTSSLLLAGQTSSLPACLLSFTPHTSLSLGSPVFRVSGQAILSNCSQASLPRSAGWILHVPPASALPSLLQESLTCSDSPAQVDCSGFIPAQAPGTTLHATHQGCRFTLICICTILSLMFISPH